MHSLKVSKYALEENLLPSRAQVVENETQTLIVRLAELQLKIQVTWWDSVVWDGEVCEDSIEAENFKFSDS